MGAAKAASAPKERRKNSEKRKEKSRDAARCRRSKESEIFTELSQQLPLPENVACQLDKASVMRLAISYLRLREILEPMATVAKSADCSPYDSSILDALDAVLLVLSAEGEIVFLSGNVGRHLGLSQVDMMGQSVYEYCHPCDHDELKAALQPGSEEPPDPSPPQPCHFLMRLRCTLRSKSRGSSIKSASSYKMMQCVGTRVVREVAPRRCPEEEQPAPATPPAVVPKQEEDASPCAVPCLPGLVIRERRHFLVCIAHPLPHPANIEVPLDSHTFLSRHNLNMRFTHVDEKTENFVGFGREDLLGKSVYSYFDPRDVLRLQQDFKTLFAKGQCETGQYRFLAKHGGSVWVLTQATLIYDQPTCTKPQCVVCVNYVLSGASQEHEVLAQEQLTCSAVQPEPQPELQPLPTALEAEEEEDEEEDEDYDDSEDDDDEELLCFTSSTSKIFAPRTADMNKGFLMFADDDSGLTVLKEESEPEDLTHLAPQAGDDSIPLEGLPSDVLGDAFSLSDIYGDDNKLLPDYALLPPEEDCPLGRKDPFLSYRDDSDPLSSPGSCGTPPSSDGEGRSSSCSDVPSLESPVDRFADLGLQHERHTGLQDDDFDMRAPYISMNGDDFPLLSPPDSVMWGPQDSPPGSTSSRSSLCDSPTFFATSPSPPRPTLGSLGPNPKSSLAALLVAELPPPPVARSREWTKHRARTNHPRSSGVSAPSRQDLARSARLTHHPHHQQQAATRSHVTRALSSVSDLRHQAYVTSALEQKMGMPSPPDPPPKRGSTERALGAGQLASPKRMRVDLRGMQLQNKDSVLLNLLVNGEDACHGYLCQTLRYDKRCPPSSPRPAPLLLDEPIPTLQDLSQLDAEVNAPIQQLLTGEDLLSALDQSVPALV